MIFNVILGICVVAYMLYCAWFLAVYMRRKDHRG